MKFAIVVFPGLNCDHDAYHAVKHVLGQSAAFLWHKDTSVGDADVVILPGGFSYGDYLRTGAIARFSPVMQAVSEFAARGGPVLGICNGFQILCEAGLLEGVLIRNSQVQFRCEHVHVRVEQTDTPFTAACAPGQVLSIPIAHGEGQFFAEPHVLARLEANRQVVFRYATAAGAITPEANCNGSLNNIAGVCNAGRNVVGLMPHPERACEKVLGSDDGLVLFESVLRRLTVRRRVGSSGDATMAGSKMMAVYGVLTSAALLLVFAGLIWTGILDLGIDPMPLTAVLVLRRPSGSRHRYPRSCAGSAGDDPAPAPRHLNHANHARRPRPPRPQGRRVRPHPGHPRPRAEPDRARHVLGDVVGALQLQELAHPPEDAAHARARACCRGPARTPAPSTSATDWPRSSRSRATTTRRSSSPTRARPPASAASSATSSPWARGPSRCSTRCASATWRSRARVASSTGVVAGIAGYGNSIGIPTVGGEACFDPCYAGNPLVNVFCLGIVPADGIVKGKADGLGNPVYYVGARTGRDGIHGATMASAEFDDASAEKRPAVQVGDPFMEKLLLEACLEVLKTGAIVGMQDMGAAGLTCATSEMSARGHVGMDVEVTKVPQRETGMSPYEIMLSESQERMLFVVHKGREAEVERIFEKWDLHAVCIGHVTDDGLVRVREHGEVVAEVPARALTDEAPLYDRPTQRPAWLDDIQHLDPTHFKAFPTTADVLSTLLASPTIASKKWIYRQYDHMVRTNTLCLAGRGTPVVRVKGTTRALAMSVDGNGRYGQTDPKRGAMLAVAEAARNVALRRWHADRRHQQPQLRQPREARDHVAVRRSRRGNRRGVPCVRAADHGRQRQPLQRDRRQGHLPDARARRCRAHRGCGHGDRPDLPRRRSEDRVAGGDASRTRRDRVPAAHPR